MFGFLSKEMAEGYKGQGGAVQSDINTVRKLIKMQLNEITAAGVKNLSTAAINCCTEKQFFMSLSCIEVCQRQEN